MLILKKHQCRFSGKYCAPCLLFWQSRHGKRQTPLFSVLKNKFPLPSHLFLESLVTSSAGGTETRAGDSREGNVDAVVCPQRKHWDRSSARLCAIVFVAKLPQRSSRRSHLHLITRLSCFSPFWSCLPDFVPPACGQCGWLKVSGIPSSTAAALSASWKTESWEWRLSPKVQCKNQFSYFHLLHLKF